MILLFLQMGVDYAFTDLWTFYIIMIQSQGNWLVRPRAVSILRVRLWLLTKLLSILSLVSSGVSFRLLTLGARFSGGASRSLILMIWSKRLGIRSLVAIFWWEAGAYMPCVVLYAVASVSCLSSFCLECLFTRFLWGDFEGRCQIN